MPYFKLQIIVCVLTFDFCPTLSCTIFPGAHLCCSVWMIKTWRRRGNVHCSPDKTLLYQRSGPEKGCDKSQSVFMKATIKAWTERGEIRVRVSSHQDKDRKALRLETLLGEFFSHQLPRHTWISLRRQKVPNCDMNISQRNTCTSCNNSNDRQELML